ncbi:MFS general substrate transporter [Xylariomycetidae sp. FL2044]|nr:MFS general substrate transporter [Xylariomycetidae sp. FL2044]
MPPRKNEPRSNTELSQPAPTDGTSDAGQAAVALTTTTTPNEDEFKHSWRLISIFALFSLVSFIAGLDASIITTSLPTITREIGGSEQYVWIANSYLFASTVPQPFYAQISNVFGRRNPLFASLALFFFGLIMGGNTRLGFPWSSWRVIFPLVLGVCGWVVFHVHQASPLCREASIPGRLFAHRTSVVGFLMIFLASTYSQATNFFLPIYFQAVKGASPLMSGVYYLPYTIATLIFAGTAGAFLSKTGSYRPIHWAGWAFGAIGAGLLSTLDERSSIGAWIGFQILCAGGVALIFTVSLPSTLAALDESDVAVATGTYAFIRTLGFVWGVTISSVAFNSQVDNHLSLISDSAVRPLLANGAAYTYASGIDGGSIHIGDLPEPSKGQVIDVYEQSLRIVWFIFVAVSIVGFVATFGERHIDLRKEHDTEFGLVRGDEALNGDAEKRNNQGGDRL